MTRMHLVAAAALLVAAPSLGAQLPNPSPAAFGMAGNYTAAATGYDAVMWNPAMLSMPGNTSASFVLMGLSAMSGVKPVTLADFAPQSGRLIPNDVKETWLQAIGTGTESGYARTGLTVLGLSNHNIGFQIANSAYGNVSLNQDAAEMLLFGNAGRTGTARPLNFAGSSADGRSFTVGAMGLSLPLPFTLTGEDDAMAIGVTAKAIFGSGYFRAQDAGSTVTDNNVSVSFPAIQSTEFQAGFGGGLDVGLAWRAGRVTVGLSAKNVVNTFKWDTTKFTARLGTATFDGTNGSTNFSDTTYSLAPQSMRDALMAEKFQPTYGAGVAVQLKPSLLLTSDVRVGENPITFEPKLHAGVGAEFTGLEFLPVRVGIAKETDAMIAAAGIGLRLWHWELAVAGMVRKAEGAGQEAGAMVNVFSFH